MLKPKQTHINKFIIIFFKNKIKFTYNLNDFSYLIVFVFQTKDERDKNPKHTKTFLRE